MSDALTAGLDALKTATLTALAGLPAQWGLGGGKPVAPVILVQPNTQGVALRYIGQPPGWRGEVAVRAQAKDADTAQAYLDQAAAVLTTLVDGTYRMRWTPLRPILGHTGPQVTTRGAVYRVEVMPL